MKLENMLCDFKTYYKALGLYSSQVVKCDISMKKDIRKWNIVESQMLTQRHIVN